MKNKKNDFSIILGCHPSDELLLKVKIKEWEYAYRRYITILRLYRDRMARDPTFSFDMPLLAAYPCKNVQTNLYEFIK